MDYGKSLFLVLILLVPLASAQTDADLTLDWYADWGTALGTDDNALYDGNKFNRQLCSHQRLEVIADPTGVFPTNNVLRMQYGPIGGSCQLIGASNYWSVDIGEYIYQRIYYYNACGPNEICVGHWWHLGDASNGYLFFWRSDGPLESDGTFPLGVNAGTIGSGQGSGNFNPTPATNGLSRLDTNHLYMVESRLYRATSTTFFMDARISDGVDGSLIWDSDDFVCAYGGGCNMYNDLLGQEPVTYSGGDAIWTNIEIGSNGNPTLPITPQYIYVGAPAVRVSSSPNDWIGPYGGSQSTGFAFEADWDQGIGTGSTAVSDGGVWNFIDGVNTLEIFSGGPQGLNYLHMPVEGSNWDAVASTTGRPLPSGNNHEFWQRVYMRVSGLDNIGIGDHGHEISSEHYTNLNFLSRQNYGTAYVDWTPGMEFFGYPTSIDQWPYNRWRPLDGLGNNIFLEQDKWYRIEHHVVLIQDAGTWYIDDIELRIIDADTDASDDADIPVLTEADFRSEFNAPAPVLTIREWADLPHDDAPPSEGRRNIEDPLTATDDWYCGSVPGCGSPYWNIVHIGYNAQAGWEAISGASYDWAGYAISLDDWVGPHGGSGSPPPSCSCGSWTNNACSAGSCSSTQMQQTRSCSPSACLAEIRCVSDASCTAPPTCPDSSCNSGETCSTCPQDCGTCPPPPSNNPGDVNEDLMVDLDDLVMMTLNLGNSGFDVRTDINSDGRVNIFDMVVVARNYGNDYSTPAPTGLVAYYDFNEGSGATLNDLSGNNNHGTVIGGATWVAGQTGNALSFDGSSGYVEVPHSTSLDIIGDEITIMAWVNSPGDGYDDIAIKGPVGSYWGLFLNDNNVEYWLIDWSGILALPIVDNSWVHVAATYDGSDVRVYVNGVESYSAPQTGLLSTNTDPLMIGRLISDTTGFFNGLIDDVRIYNRALTPTEIQTDMNS